MNDNLFFVGILILAIIAMTVRVAVTAINKVGGISVSFPSPSISFDLPKLDLKLRSRAEQFWRRIRRQNTLEVVEIEDDDRLNYEAAEQVIKIAEFVRKGATALFDEDELIISQNDQIVGRYVDLGHKDIAALKEIVNLVRGGAIFAMLDDEDSDKVTVYISSNGMIIGECFEYGILLGRHWKS